MDGTLTTVALVLSKTVFSTSFCLALCLTVLSQVRRLKDTGFLCSAVWAGLVIAFRKFIADGLPLYNLYNSVNMYCVTLLGSVRVADACRGLASCRPSLRRRRILVSHSEVDRLERANCGDHRRFVFVSSITSKADRQAGLASEHSSLRTWLQRM